MNTMITPVILAGGAGKRLWPLSRKSYPKQFSNLIGEKTLFQSSAIRVQSSKKLQFKSPITLTNEDYRFIVKEQLHLIGVDPGQIVIEPKSRNTAASILAATLLAESDNPNAILLVCPSDHLIPDTSKFHTSVKNGLAAIEDGNLVTFGIKPTHPNTTYGYLEIEEENTNGIFPLKRFVEKPTKDVANNMFNQRNYFWNAGIFLFKTKDMLAAFKLYFPDLLSPVREAVEAAKSDIGFLRLSSKHWEKCKNISIDYAIMEHATNIVAVPFAQEWSDLGGWDAVWNANKADYDGVVISENATAIECKDVLLRSENSKQQIVGLGLENIIAIAMPDAVLVSKKDRAQDVKMIVDVLKEQNVEQAETFPKDHRPWGWFESMVTGSRFQVKRIHVHPGAALSLQSHHHRSEHWIVVEGTAKVTIDNVEKFLSEGQSIYVPVGAVHRMENPGKIPMVLIEVQTGPYLEEDDITRYQDKYSRN